MTTDIYKINNSKLICRLLPFFARGRKMILFLEAVASPLISLHRTFLLWAFDIILSVKMTAQTDVLVWYLNYLFKARFHDATNAFRIEQDFDPRYLIAYNYREIAAFKFVGVKIYNKSEDIVSKPVKDYGEHSLSESIVIHAPKLKVNGDDGYDSSYTPTVYASEIMAIIDKYKTSYRQYSVVININE